ncbi:hypothetical protein [Ktedonospora formicarum]|uniref:Uncharacterized protein n=1 Tax=Ktedonospora formicarum TaxID=2778364 RepID=A0A8J3I4Q7_9CHLR|nr:hypothetical protein [Ktedonospora formicarum]GHO49454.1 hypothetical protein KSX_76170 [Ktedonospora formicarum]
MKELLLSNRCLILELPMLYEELPGRYEALFCQHNTHRIPGSLGQAIHLPERSRLRGLNAAQHTFGLKSKHVAAKLAAAQAALANAFYTRLSGEHLKLPMLTSIYRL